MIKNLKEKRDDSGCKKRTLEAGRKMWKHI